MKWLIVVDTKTDEIEDYKCITDWHCCLVLPYKASLCEELYRNFQEDSQRLYGSDYGVIVMEENDTNYWAVTCTKVHYDHHPDGLSRSDIIKMLWHPEI